MLANAEFYDTLWLEDLLESFEQVQQAAARNVDKLDRVRGMFAGLMLGDALGAPHERRNGVALSEYTGCVQHRFALYNRFTKTTKVSALGQITDDTEMAIALADALVRSGGFSYETTLQSYLDWTATKPPFCGKNTKNLLGAKSQKTYHKKMATVLSLPEAARSESNGCLMRAAPLAVLPNWQEAAILDCRLTNPNAVCQESVLTYVHALRLALKGTAPNEICDSVAMPPRHKSVARSISDGRLQAVRDIKGHDKGWAPHALYCAFFALGGEETGFRERLDKIIKLGGDTDTNGAIAGALIGAVCGYANMTCETTTAENLNVVLNCNTTEADFQRPTKYAANVLFEMSKAIASLEQNAPSPFTL